MLNLGAGAVPFFDRGAIERQEVSNSDVDLATIAVSGPTSGVQDGVVTVNWTVQNIGVGPAIGSWHDAVYLSVDPVWTPDDQLLGEKLHNGDVGPGLTYSDSASVTLPGALPGDYFFIVRSDGRNEVFEALAKLNNPRASADRITLDLPALFLGTPLNGQLTATGSSKFYKIAAPAGADLVVNVTGPAGATNELYLKFADIPSRQVFDERGIRANQPAQALSVSSTRAGNYFVMVFGANLPSPETFTLTARLTGFSISSVTPTRGSNTGQVTIAIAGAQFDGNSQPRLIDSACGMLQPTRVYFTDSGLISATFDLTGRPTGLANVQVVNTGNVTTSFVAAVSLDATLLPPSMGLNYSVRDVFGLEIQKAIAAINTSVSGRLFLKDAVHPIGNVPVTLATANQSVAFTTATLTDGTFLLRQVPAGTYQLTFEGFATGTPVSTTVGSSDVNAGKNYCDSRRVDFRRGVSESVRDSSGEYGCAGRFRHR